MSDISRDAVEVVEVGPRDGLQNDPADLMTAAKVEFIQRVLDAGVRRVEVASFVNPTRVPKMADAEAVVAGLPPAKGRSYIGLVLNLRGFDRARATAVNEINCVVVASETFSQRNQGMSTEDSLGAALQVTALARKAGLRSTVTIAASFGCPYEGEVEMGRVVGIARRCAEAGVDEIALADTIGCAVPREVTDRVLAVAGEVGGVPLRGHFHNTRNTGYANALAAVEAGVRTLDASLGGIGGCPFAPNATGNIATQDLVWTLHRSGFSTGVDLDGLLRAGAWLDQTLKHGTPGLLAKAGAFPDSPAPVAG